MSEALVQALIRLVVGGAIAAIAFIVTNIAVLGDALINAGVDPFTAGTVLTIVVAILNFVTKFLGGPTEAAPRQVGRGLGGAKRPNIFAV